MSDREHHDEERDRLAVEALQSAQQCIRCQRVNGCPDPEGGYTCPSCRALGKIDAALRVMAR